MFQSGHACKTNLETPLCARVLRPKYYPDGKILNAKVKQGSSFTWQSIVAGLQCFKRGVIWRVGDGSQIDICTDQWILSSPTGKVMTPRGTNIYSKVQDLINPGTGEWDEELIRSMFWNIEEHYGFVLLIFGSAS